MMRKIILIGSIVFSGLCAPVPGIGLVFFLRAGTRYVDVDAVTNRLKVVDQKPAKGVFTVEKLSLTDNVYAIKHTGLNRYLFVQNVPDAISRGYVGAGTIMSSDASVPVFNRRAISPGTLFGLIEDTQAAAGTIGFRINSLETWCGGLSVDGNVMRAFSQNPLASSMTGALQTAQTEVVATSSTPAQFYYNTKNDAGTALVAEYDSSAGAVSSSLPRSDVLADATLICLQQQTFFVTVDATDAVRVVGKSEFDTAAHFLVRYDATKQEMTLTTLDGRNVVVENGVCKARRGAVPDIFLVTTTDNKNISLVRKTDSKNVMVAADLTVSADPTAAAVVFTTAMPMGSLSQLSTNPSASTFAADLAIILTTLKQAAASSDDLSAILDIVKSYVAVAAKSTDWSNNNVLSLNKKSYSPQTYLNRSLTNIVGGFDVSFTGITSVEEAKIQDIIAASADSLAVLRSMADNLTTISSLTTPAAIKSKLDDIARLVVAVTPSADLLTICTPIIAETLKLYTKTLTPALTADDTKDMLLHNVAIMDGALPNTYAYALKELLLRNLDGALAVIANQGNVLVTRDSFKILAPKVTAFINQINQYGQTSADAGDKAAFKVKLTTFLNSQTLVLKTQAQQNGVDANYNFATQSATSAILPIFTRWIQSLGSSVSSGSGSSGLSSSGSAASSGVVPTFSNKDDVFGSTRQRKTPSFSSSSSSSSSSGSSTTSSGSSTVVIPRRANI